MKDKILRCFVFGTLLLAVVLFSGFVSAVAGAPTSINVTFNSTALYDEGHFTINWTSGGGNTSSNYTIYIYMNDVHVNTSYQGNTSNLGYTFSNTTQANYTFTVEAVNYTAVGTNATSNVSMYIDTTSPGMTIALPAAAGWKGGSLTLHANSTDALSNVTSSTIAYGFSNDTGNFSITTPGTCAWAGVTATGYNCSLTFTTSGLADGNYTLWFNSTDAVGNLGYADVAIGVDNTAPTVSVSKSTSATSSVTVDYSCTDAGSGVATCALSSSSGTFSGNKVSGLTCGTSYDITITSTDGLASSGSSTVSMSTSGCSNNAGGSSGTTTVPTVRSDYSFDKIVPGVASVVRNFATDVGVKEININVNSEAENVKVNVIKYGEKPSSVSTAKTGKVYQYLQIETENLESKLDKATVQFRAEKSWASNNGLTKDVVGVFRFNEGTNAWDELPATTSGEDDSYYYYTVDLISFSYFAISEKAVLESGGDDTTEDGSPDLGDEGGSSLTWLWILIGVLVVVAVGFGANKMRN